MTTGRTKHKYWRVYVDGYDMSGYSRTIGPLEFTFDEANLTADMGDVVKGYLPNTAHANVGTLNTVFDNTATIGVHTIMRTAGTSYRYVMVPIGIQAAPADGDPCFGGTFLQDAYQVTNDGGAITATIPFAGWSATVTPLYCSPWGTLLHAKLAATGANAAAGFDNPTANSTTKGGFFLYQIFTSSGAGHTATLSVDDSANNADWAALVGATSGPITVTAGVSGMVALASNATVRRYLRWQLSLGTATSVTFASAFMRAYTQS